MYFRNVDASAIADWARSQRDAEGGILLVLAAVKNHHEIAPAMEGLRSDGIQAIGGVFYQVTVDDAIYDEGCVVSNFKGWRTPRIIDNIDQPDFDLSVLPERSEVPPHSTVLVFADSLSRCLPDFLNSLSERYGNGIDYLGGGAGAVAATGLMDQHQAAVFTSENGLAPYSAAVAFVTNRSSVRTRHGWKRIYGPLVATKVEGHIIVELNWRPAFDVYKEVVESYTGEPLDRNLENLYTVGFPFGMFKEGSEDVVRLPYTVTDEGGLVCIGGLQSNSVLHILQGVPEELIGAAGETARLCSEGLGSAASNKILIDCVTRYLYLKEDFAAELKAVREGLAPLGDAPVLGALSEGEISSLDGGYFEMLNKSVVVGAFS